MKAPRSQSVDSKLSNLNDTTSTNSSASGKARTVCTEILPLKTDEKGRIIFNFSEATSYMKEDEIKDQLREKYFNLGRILIKRNCDATEDKQKDEDGVVSEIIIRRASDPDLDANSS
ncbi:unnamed protein product [Hermetia illucens]|uniref:Uncharacterized protein n=2 Tax=Hermetia illucens TaxID=343691 RepID=A0A7R8UII4_HERIL|nr:unnamed protein product [Hermetia illucens]